MGSVCHVKGARTASMIFPPPAFSAKVRISGSRPGKSRPRFALAWPAPTPQVSMAYCQNARPRSRSAFYSYLVARGTGSSLPPSAARRVVECPPTSRSSMNPKAPRKHGGHSASVNLNETTLGPSARFLDQGKQVQVVAINFASCPSPSSRGLVRNLAVIYPDVPFKPWREPVQRFPDSPTFHVWAMGESLPRAPCGMLDLMTNSGMPGQCQR